MSNLTTKLNKFIKQIEFNADGSLSITIQQEFEINLENGDIVKVPHQGERVRLEIDDPNAESVAGIFYPAFQQYWLWYKENKK
jgi:hypothetical protein